MIYKFNGMKVEIDVEIAQADPTIGEPKPFMCDFMVLSVEGCASEALCDYIQGRIKFSDVEAAYKAEFEDE